MRSKHSIRRKLEMWKELLPTIGRMELYRLLLRLRRHARVFSCSAENGKIAVVVGYPSLKDRMSSRVLLSSWIGKKNYQSVKLDVHGWRRTKIRL